MKNIKKIIFFCIFSFVFFFCFETLPAEAVNLRQQINGNLEAGKTSSGLGTKDLRLTVASIIQTVLSTFGIIFTTLMVISGYNILTAAGDESKVDKAKKTIQACIVGLAITLAAYGITSFVTKSAQDAVNGTVEQRQDNRWGPQENHDNIAVPVQNAWDYLFN